MVMRCNKKQIMTIETYLTMVRLQKNINEEVKLKHFIVACSKTWCFYFLKYDFVDFCNTVKLGYNERIFRSQMSIYYTNWPCYNEPRL